MPDDPRAETAADETFPGGEPLLPREYIRMRDEGMADAFGTNLGGYDPNGPTMGDSGGGDFASQPPRLDIGTASNFTDWAGGRGYESDRPQAPLMDDPRLHATDAFGVAMQRDQRLQYQNEMAQWRADQETVARQREAQRQNPQNQLAELDQQIAQTRLSQPEQLLSARLRQAVAGIQEQLTNGSISPETARLMHQQVTQNAQQLWAREGSLPEMLRRQQYLEAQHQAAMVASIQNEQARHRAQAAAQWHTTVFPDGNRLYHNPVTGRELLMAPGPDRNQDNSDPNQPVDPNYVPPGIMYSAARAAAAAGDVGNVTELRRGRVTSPAIVQQAEQNRADIRAFFGGNVPEHVSRLPESQQLLLGREHAQHQWDAAYATQYRTQAEHARTQWDHALARRSTGATPGPVPLTDAQNPEWIRHAVERWGAPGESRRGPVTDDEIVGFRAHEQASRHLQNGGPYTPAQIIARNRGPQAGQGGTQPAPGGNAPGQQPPPRHDFAVQHTPQEVQTVQNNLEAMHREYSQITDPAIQPYANALVGRLAHLESMIREHGDPARMEPHLQAEWRRYDAEASQIRETIRLRLAMPRRGPSPASRAGRAIGAGGWDTNF